MTAAASNLLLINPEEIAPASRSAGLGHWMRQVLSECDKVRVNFAPDPVHDLRVALRRCRSLADGFMTLDSRPAWKQMKRAGKELFSQLGALRDLHVMVEWIQHLAPADDPIARFLLDLSANREPALKQAALAALDGFDRDRWKDWAEVLPKRAERIPLDSLVFRHLALERWNSAYQLHHRALRNRSKAGFHQLRIGLKKFRYTVENFLPALHDAWSDDLKKTQDWLGDVHDLDVLWATALQTKAFPDHADPGAGSHAEDEERKLWRDRIESARNQRLQKYREEMVGLHSLWHTWRAELPQDTEVESGAIERVRIWAGFLDPEPSHAEAVARISLQLFDGLAGCGFRPRNPRARTVLHVAALVHEVGRAKRDRNHHKLSARYIRRLQPPLGLKAHDLQLAALVARYHRGQLPSAAQVRFARLAETHKHLIKFLAGILRLTVVLNTRTASQLRSITVEKTGDFLTILVQGNIQEGRRVERIAAARYLLEVACGCPVIVRQEVPRQKTPRPRTLPKP